MCVCVCVCVCVCERERERESAGVLKQRGKMKGVKATHFIITFITITFS